LTAPITRDQCSNFWPKSCCGPHIAY